MAVFRDEEVRIVWELCITLLEVLFQGGEWVWVAVPEWFGNGGDGAFTETVAFVVGDVVGVCDDMLLRCCLDVAVNARTLYFVWWKKCTRQWRPTY